jgi:hypothetical protein
MEFWALIGLACLDHVFLRELEANIDNLQKPVREFGFRLTRWEMGELYRILTVPDAFHHMHEICQMLWGDAFNPQDQDPCWWSAERSHDHDRRGEPPYRHPLQNGHPVPRPDSQEQA